MATSPKIKLNNGLEIPVIGFGTGVGNGTSLPTAKDWILSAIKCVRDSVHMIILSDWTNDRYPLIVLNKSGVRHIDTAKYYGTEKAVGQAIQESGIPREEFWVTTKLPWFEHDRVRESFEQSLASLGLDYVDMYMIHWPAGLEYEPNNPYPKNPDGSWRFNNITFNIVWAEMEKLLETGKVKTIGVCNFSVKLLEELLTTAKVVPAMNQVEMHPYLAQNALRHYCARKGIAITAYTPSGYKTVREDPLIVSLAEKYKVTPNQVIIAWHISRGQALLPTSHNPERQRENTEIKTLDEADLAKIWDLDRGQRVCTPPDAEGKVFQWTLEKLGWESYHPKVVQ